LLLLACPLLQQAQLFIPLAAPTAVSAVMGPQLPCHSSLVALRLEACSHWGDAAAAHFQHLAPVCGGVRTLRLYEWPGGTSSHRMCGLPDLSCCTALSALKFSSEASGCSFVPEQEDFLSMLAPLVGLQLLEIHGAERFNARAVVALQYMLPHLTDVVLDSCGGRLPLADVITLQPEEQQQQQQYQPEQQLVAKVRQQLRPGLLFHVQG
jgi:hypothetical protein